MIRLRNFILFAILGSIACASGSGGPLFRREIGTASAIDAVTLAEQVIARHGYEIHQSDPGPDMRILTYWRPRSPFADEAALGVTAAESRILVTARERAQTELGALYNVHMTVENRVRVAGSPDWNHSVNTDGFEDYADEIVENFRTELNNIGVRRLGCCD
jgi:hypothetical protein